MIGLETWEASVGQFDVDGGVVLLGVLTGLTYALLAVGLVLVYRSSRFINFAHIGIGLFGAAIMSLAVDRYGIPYWPSLVIGMVVSALAAVVTEVVVVAKLRDQPRLLSMVATLGMASFFFFAALALNPDGLQGLQFPRPDGLPTFEVDSLFVDTYYTAQALLSPLLLAALSLFLWKSRYGIAIRGAASNPDAAALSGVSPSAMSVLSWGLAGALAAVSAAVLIPSKGAVSPETLGPDLLLRALAAAAIVRFASIGGALVAAVAIGVVEQILATSSSGNGYADLLIFVAVMVSLLATRRGTRDEPEPWDGLAVVARPPRSHRDVWWLRHLPTIGIAVVVVVGLLAPVWMSNSTAGSATQVLSLALVGVSVTIISGMGGQLSLGQFAIGGIGAAVAISATDASGSFILGLVAATFVAGAVSALIGIPALRVPGLLLGVATLSFALMCESWLLRRDALLGDGGAETNAPDLGILDGASRNYYYVALAALAVGMLLAHNLRGGSFGRKLAAVRDNGDAASALSINATAVKIQAYVVAGMLAGLGGAVYAQSFSKIDSSTFAVQRSIDVVLIAVVGGIGSLFGPLIGSLYLVGIPQFLEVTDPEALAGLAAIWLVTLTYQPRGFAGLIADLGARIRLLLGRVAGVDADGALAEVPTQAPMRLDDETDTPTGSSPVGVSDGAGALLSVRGVSKHFGGLTAVDEVSFDVVAGETVGLIGPNGAGKTTLFEMVSGFVVPDAGAVVFDGADVTARPPHLRSRDGMVRSFQSATLFPTLSVLDTVMIARERVTPGRLLRNAAGIRAGEHVRERDAMELIERFGLAAFADTPVAMLPTGTRRLVELACAVAVEPRCILLDEPSAGLAQAETEQLAEVLAALRTHYDVTLVVIEHDMPLLHQLCDRMIALEVGRVIAEGTPAEIQAHPAVIESYLGTNAVSIARSGPAAASPAAPGPAAQ